MDKKSILVGALASALLFVTLGASNPVTIQSTVPPDHVWEFHINDPGVANAEGAFAINKVTGEVRRYNTGSITANKKYGTFFFCTDYY